MPNWDLEPTGSSFAASRGRRCAMSEIVFITVVGGSSALIGALVFSIVWPTMSVWPSRQEEGPFRRVRRVVGHVNGVLVAISGLGVLLLAVLDRGSLHLGIGPRWFVGTGLLLSGGILGLWGYLQLGADVSHGARAPLETSGPYRYSRNPQYVGAIGVLLGFCLIWSSGLALLAAAVCSIWFLIAPFAEEPWLRRRLGPGYDAYLAATPRFLGMPRLAQRAA